MAANQLTKPITILFWDANFILNNINDLQISLIENQVDIAMISETHLTNNSAFKIFSYNILRADHPDDTAHGGSAQIIFNKIAHTLSLLSTSLDMQITNTSLLIDSVPISITSAYLPPGRKFPENKLQYLSTLNHTFLLGADFNAKHHCWGCFLINTRSRISLFLLEPNMPKYMHHVHQRIGLLT